MAILGTLAFGFVYMAKNIPYKIFLALIFVSLFFTIYETDARQGLISIITGISFFIAINIYFTNKKYGALSFGALGASLFFGILGMLQIGPLTSLLYKDSVTVRGYYWRAGIKMFQEHPFFGVGLDNFGAYFKEVRETSYPLKYGFDITSSAAHNVYIQMLSTGGLFLGLMYLMLNIFVVYFGIKSLQKMNKSQRIAQTTLISAFLAFIAQSIVSIDNLGIAIWGWVLMGAILALGRDINSENLVSNKGKQINKINLLQATVSGFIFLITLIITVFLYKGEHNMYVAAGYYNPAAQNQRELFHQYTTSTLKTPLLEPRHKLTSGMYLVSFGFVDEGMKNLNEIVERDPRNLDALNVLAEFSIQLGKFDDAIKYRSQIAKLDPWNAKNYLALGAIYKQTNDPVNMLKMLDKIKSFAGNSQIYLDAKAQLVTN
jgi:tetratricopeptide (TPR) repeat protein